MILAWFLALFTIYVPLCKWSQMWNTVFCLRSAVYKENIIFHAYIFSYLLHFDL